MLYFLDRLTAPMTSTGRLYPLAFPMCGFSSEAVPQLEDVSQVAPYTIAL